MKTATVEKLKAAVAGKKRLPVIEAAKAAGVSLTTAKKYIEGCPHIFKLEAKGYCAGKEYYGVSAYDYVSLKVAA